MPNFSNKKFFNGGNFIFGEEYDTYRIKTMKKKFSRIIHRNNRKINIGINKSKKKCKL